MVVLIALALGNSVKIVKHVYLYLTPTSHGNALGNTIQTRSIFSIVCIHGHQCQPGAIGFRDGIHFLC